MSLTLEEKQELLNELSSSLKPLDYFEPPIFTKEVTNFLALELNFFPKIGTGDVFLKFISSGETLA